MDADERIRESGWDVTESGCWEWRGPRNNKGYMHLGFDGKIVGVHRLAYETWVGPIPEGHVVMHSCDNRSCINPDHLRTGTQRENLEDMTAKGHRAVGERNGMAKLTAELVRKMRAEFSTGETAAAIARRYGVGETAAWNVVHNNTWKEVI